MADRDQLERYWGRGVALEAVADTRAIVRAASTALYSPSFGYQVVPRVDQRTRRSNTDNVAGNPVLMMPPWRLGFAMGRIPIKSYRLTIPTGGGHPIPTEAPDHPVYALLRKPNEWLTRSLLISGTVASMVIFNRCAWFKDRDPTGKVVGLYPIPGRFIKPMGDAKSMISGYRLTVPGQPTDRLKPSDVCYFRLMPDPDNWIDGWTPLQSLFGAGDVSEGAAGSMAEIFRTGVLQRLWVQLKDRVDDDVRFARLEAQLEKMVGARSGIPILEEDAELKTAGDGPNDALMTRSWDWAVALVEWMFGLKGDRSDFYADVVAPIADGMEQELERSLYSEFPSDPAYPSFMYRSILIGSPKEQAEYWQTEINSGQATPNDARVAQDRPPVEGGDVTLVPLNLAAISPGSAGPAADQPGPTPKKGSSDGFGGDQGKGTQPSAGDGAGAKAAAANRRLRAARQTNWGQIRSGVVDPHGAAMARRLRGLLKVEAGKVQEQAQGLAVSRSRAHRAGFEPPMPSIDELLAVLSGTDPEIAAIVRAQMTAIAGAAGPAAATFMGATEQAEVASAVFTLINQRSLLVAERFGDYRARGLRNTVLAWAGMGNPIEGVPGDADIRDLAALISGWADRAAHYVDGIARTESAFAFEKAAMVTWSDAGISVVELVFGGGPCRTGVCEEAAAAGPQVMGSAQGDVGYSFEGTDSPPLHPSCTCYLVPSETQDLSKLEFPAEPNAAISGDVLEARYAAKDAKAGRDFLRRGMTSADMKGAPAAQAQKRAINDELLARLSGDPEFMKWWDANGYDLRAMYGTTGDNYVLHDLRDALDQLIRAWASTSGDHSPISIATQLAAQAEFGLAGQSSVWWAAEDVLRAQQVLAANETFLRTALRAMYDWTQAEFAARGITEVALIRGQGLVEALGRTGTSGAKEIAELLLQPMSSFSTEKGVATWFTHGAGYGTSGWVRVTVPVSRILASCRTGFGCLNEHEFIVLASDGQVMIEWR